MTHRKKRLVPCTKCGYLPILAHSESGELFQYRHPLGNHCERFSFWFRRPRDAAKSWNEINENLDREPVAMTCGDCHYFREHQMRRKSACFLIKGGFICDAPSGINCVYNDSGSLIGCTHDWVYRSGYRECRHDDARTEAANDAIEQAKHWLSKKRCGPNLCDCPIGVVL